MARIPWRFYDPVDLVEYAFEINPIGGGVPDRRKNVSARKTTAPGAEGKTLLFEGADEVPNVSISNVVLSETQYTAFETWFDKRHQIRLTDDLNRSWWIYITGLKLERERSVQYPWRHKYTIDYVVLGPAEPE